MAFCCITRVVHTDIDILEFSLAFHRVLKTFLGTAGYNHERA